MDQAEVFVILQHSFKLALGKKNLNPSITDMALKQLNRKEDFRGNVYSSFSLVSLQVPQQTRAPC